VFGKGLIRKTSRIIVIDGFNDGKELQEFIDEIQPPLDENMHICVTNKMTRVFQLKCNLLSMLGVNYAIGLFINKHTTYNIQKLLNIFAYYIHLILLSFY